MVEVASDSVTHSRRSSDSRRLLTKPLEELFLLYPQVISQAKQKTIFHLPVE